MQHRQPGGETDCSRGCCMIAYVLPEITGRNFHKSWVGEWAFWLSNIGMICMTGAFAVAGITQVYLERKVGMDFLLVQEAVQVHFFGLILAATLFTIGVVLFIWNFARHGNALKLNVQSPTENHDEEVALAE